VSTMERWQELINGLFCTDLQRCSLTSGGHSLSMFGKPMLSPPPLMPPEGELASIGCPLPLESLPVTDRHGGASDLVGFLEDRDSSYLGFFFFCCLDTFNRCSLFFIKLNGPFPNSCLHRKNLQGNGSGPFGLSQTCREGQSRASFFFLYFLGQSSTQLCWLLPSLQIKTVLWGLCELWAVL
jgi:hypothetical protein